MRRFRKLRRFKKFRRFRKLRRFRSFRRFRRFRCSRSRLEVVPESLLIMPPHAPGNVGKLLGNNVIQSKSLACQSQSHKVLQVAPGPDARRSIRAKEDIDLQQLQNLERSVRAIIHRPGDAHHALALNFDMKLTDVRGGLKFELRRS